MFADNMIVCLEDTSESNAKLPQTRRVFPAGKEVIKLTFRNQWLSYIYKKKDSTLGKKYNGIKDSHLQ